MREDRIGPRIIVGAVQSRCQPLPAASGELQAPSFLHLRPLLPHDDPRSGVPAPVFFFFSNRLGCLGSLLISVALTAILLLIFF